MKTYSDIRLSLIAHDFINVHYIALFRGHRVLSILPNPKSYYHRIIEWSLFGSLFWVIY